MFNLGNKQNPLKAVQGSFLVLPISSGNACSGDMAYIQLCIVEVVWQSMWGVVNTIN